MYVKHVKGRALTLFIRITLWHAIQSEHKSLHVHLACCLCAMERSFNDNLYQTDASDAKRTRLSVAERLLYNMCTEHGDLIDICTSSPLCCIGICEYILSLLIMFVIQALPESLHSFPCSFPLACKETLLLHTMEHLTDHKENCKSLLKKLLDAGERELVMTIASRVMNPKTYMGPTSLFRQLLVKQMEVRYVRERDWTMIPSYIRLTLIMKAEKVSTSYVALRRANGHVLQRLQTLVLAFSDLRVALWYYMPILLAVSE